jgi:ferredoxin
VRRAVQCASLALYLYLFFCVSWPYARILSSQVPGASEWMPVEAFLWIDPLVGLSTAVAARSWNVALIGMAAVLALSLVLPRGFCGYLCPLGTLIDGFDFALGRHLRRFRVKQIGAWANLRFWLLVAVLAASLCGVLLSGVLAAIPVLTRGLLFTGGQLQLGVLKNWSMVPALGPTGWVSLALFLGVFLLGLLGPRFWCRYVCPSGALVSLGSGLRLFRRQVNDRCVQCGQCIRACPFDAINADISTRTLSCTFCQTCAGVCPQRAIDFVPRHASESPRQQDTIVGRPVSRRALLLSGVGGATSALLTGLPLGARARPIRPPGSVPEAQFLDLCIRCEQCLKVCPGPVLRAAALDHGVEALWTPVADFAHAGCHQDCNFCTQICPTGAIQPLTIQQKRRAQMGLAVIEAHLCLPHRGERDCQLCFEECNAAGYRAIEMRPIQLATGQLPEGSFSPEEVEAMSRISAPFIKPDACVGCGLCEYRCHAANVQQRSLIRHSAVVVKAEGMMAGSNK